MYWKGDASCDDPTCRNAKDTSQRTGYMHFCLTCFQKLRAKNKCENCGVHERIGYGYSGRINDYVYDLATDHDPWCTNCRSGWLEMQYRISEQETELYGSDQNSSITNTENKKDEGTGNTFPLVIGFLMFVATMAFNVWILYLLWNWLF